MMRKIVCLFAFLIGVTVHGFEAKLIDLNKLPPLREVIQVKDLALDMFETECLYNPSSKLAVESKSLTLPTQSFKYLTSINCAIYKDMVVDAANDSTRMASTNNGFDPILALKFTYGSNVGHVRDQSFYLVAIGADGKGIVIDDGGTVGNEIPKTGLLVYDYCIALDNNHTNGHMWSLGSTAIASGTQTNARNLASALGYEFCLSTQ